MKMVIGGACQGKKSYAQRVYPGISWCDGAECTTEELLSCQGVYGFEQFIRRWLAENRDRQPGELAEAIIAANPGLIVVTAEIGYGLVPVDAFDRYYREAVGRICTELAGFSERVDRVLCGIGTRIK